MLNKWYCLKKDCVAYYAEYASTSLMDYDFIESHLTKPFKVKELYGFGQMNHVTKIIAPNWFGDIEVNIKIADMYEFFEEVEGWIEGGIYQLIDRPGFVNNSKINIRINEDINTKLFKVLKTSWGGRCDKIAFMDGSGTYNAALVSNELKFFKMIDTANDSFDMANAPKITGSVGGFIKDIPKPKITGSLDELIKDIPEPKTEKETLLFVDGKINIVVDDEASRLFVIKALQNVRFK